MFSLETRANTAPSFCTTVVLHFTVLNQLIKQCNDKKYFYICNASNMSEALNDKIWGKYIYRQPKQPYT